MTTQDIIKILPFDMDFKTELFLRYDRLTEDQKCNIMDIIWRAYDAYFNLRLNWNLQVAMDKSLTEGNKSIEDPKFYQSIVEQTKKEIMESAGKETGKFDLSATRVALQDVMQKIKASQ